MIEQVFYRRDQSGGYNEYYSPNLSQEEAHKVNLLLNNIATYIPSLDAGQDTPMFIFPLEDQNRICIAKLSGEFFGGRKNQVQHGLLMAAKEYDARVRKPEMLFGLTNKNFISVRTNRKNEMVSLKELVVEENADLNVEKIISEYKLNNDEFLRFMSVIYTTLSKDKDYTCGIVMDSARNSIDLLKQLGYLIVSLLPYQLRKKISFGSTGAPVESKITVQILKHSDSREAVDVTYNLDTKQTIENSKIKVTDFYLDSLLGMSEQELRNYFDFLESFEEELNISDDDRKKYVVSKLAILVNRPELFSKEKINDQLSFIKDVLELQTQKKDFLKQMVIQLMQYVDAEKHMELFEINYELYMKLEKESHLIPAIERNIIQNFNDSSDDEKVMLFHRIYESNKSHITLCTLLKELMKECNDSVSSALIEQYILLFDEINQENFRELIYGKINRVFQLGSIEDKKMIWEIVISKIKGNQKFVITYCLLMNNKEEDFPKYVISSLIELYEMVYGKNDRISTCYYTKILEVFDKIDDQCILSVMNQLKEVSEIKDVLWLEAYKRIEDKKALQQNVNFKSNLEYKFYHTNNQEMIDLYMEYIVGSSQRSIEGKIHDIWRNKSSEYKIKQLTSRILGLVTEKKMVISVEKLKELIEISNRIDISINDLAKYIRENYLAVERDDNEKIYEFLEYEYDAIFNSIYLNKEKYPSYDKYLASKISIEHVSSVDVLLNILEILESVVYHEISYRKITQLYYEYIDREMSECKSDLDRYGLCDKYERNLQAVWRTEFGRTYYHELKKHYSKAFWDASSVDTYDYKNRGIYGRNGVVFDEQYTTHENYLLTAKIEQIFVGYSTDWDTVYEIVLTNKVIKNSSLRVKIGNDFKKEYRANNMYRNDVDFIALASVDLKTLKMDYQKLFVELQRNNYSFNVEMLRRMLIFKYISPNPKIKAELRKYNNYQSEYPRYTEVHVSLLVNQIVSLLLLVGGDLIYSKALKTTASVVLRNRYLIISCGTFITVALILSILTIIMLRKVSLRTSGAFDLYMYGLLSINYLLMLGAVLLGATIVKLFISITIIVLLILIAIVINILIWIRINKFNSNGRY